MLCRPSPLVIDDGECESTFKQLNQRKQIVWRRLCSCRVVASGKWLLRVRILDFHVSLESFIFLELLSGAVMCDFPEIHSQEPGKMY